MRTREAFDALRARMRESGTAIVLTGFGGDELMALRSAERRHVWRPPRLPSWVGERVRDAMPILDVGVCPVTPVALPTLVVFAARHPAYLRAGLWPVAPLSHPALSEFGRSLPADWRADKRLLRARLARAGLPRQVTNPRRPESFSSTMQLALRRHGGELLSSMLDKSVLIGHGFVDRAAVGRLRRHAANGYPIPPMVYDMLALEIGIRSMVEHQQGAVCSA